MKKLSLVALSMALCGAAAAQDGSANQASGDPEALNPFVPQEHPVAYAEIGFATPIQYPSPEAMVNGVRFNLIYGESFGVYGFDFGLVGFNRDSAEGLALYAGVDWTENDFIGAQFGGIANVALGNSKGFELAGIVNYNRGCYTGGQIGLINFDGEFIGGQIGGFNYDKGVCWGFQLGFANAAVNEYHGWSIGAVNYAERLYGLQFGGVNIAAETGRGIQIGVFNCADNFIGMQIGLLNIIGNGDLPIMPILNARF
ncbi:MAG: hypothetical protein K6F50_09340 [Kiritimatiellae bacterium]|nr:hypothetical protein [Kiritimatiellia bacterium]